MLNFHYHVKILAEDFVGLRTQVTSEGVTIDPTPPEFDASKLTVSGDFLTIQNNLQVSYTNVFRDPESGNNMCFAYGIWIIKSDIPGIVLAY